MRRSGTDEDCTVAPLYRRAGRTEVLAGRLLSRETQKHTTLAVPSRRERLEPALRRLLEVWTFNRLQFETLLPSGAVHDTLNFRIGRGFNESSAAKSVVKEFAVAMCPMGVKSRSSLEIFERRASAQQVDLVEHLLERLQALQDERQSLREELKRFDELAEGSKHQRTVELSKAQRHLQPHLQESLWEEEALVVQTISLGMFGGILRTRHQELKNVRHSKARDIQWAIEDNLVALLRLVLSRFVVDLSMESRDTTDLRLQRGLRSYLELLVELKRKQSIAHEATAAAEVTGLEMVCALQVEALSCLAYRCCLSDEAADVIATSLRELQHMLDKWNCSLPVLVRRSANLYALVLAISTKVLPSTPPSDVATAVRERQHRIDNLRYEWSLATGRPAGIAHKANFDDSAKILALDGLINVEESELLIETQFLASGVVARTALLQRREKLLALRMAIAVHSFDKDFFLQQYQDVDLDLQAATQLLIASAAEDPRQDQPAKLLEAQLSLYQPLRALLSSQEDELSALRRANRVPQMPTPDISRSLFLLLLQSETLAEISIAKLGAASIMAIGGSRRELHDAWGRLLALEASIGTRDAWYAENHACLRMLMRVAIDGVAALATTGLEHSHSSAVTRSRDLVHHWELMGLERLSTVESRFDPVFRHYDSVRIERKLKAWMHLQAIAVVVAVHAIAERSYVEGSMLWEQTQRFAVARLSWLAQEEEMIKLSLEYGGGDVPSAKMQNQVATAFADAFAHAEDEAALLSSMLQGVTDNDVVKSQLKESLDPFSLLKRQEGTRLDLCRLRDLGEDDYRITASIELAEEHVLTSAFRLARGAAKGGSEDVLQNLTMVATHLRSVRSWEASQQEQPKPCSKGFKHVDETFEIYNLCTPLSGVDLVIVGLERSGQAAPTSAPLHKGGQASNRRDAEAALSGVVVDILGARCSAPRSARETQRVHINRERPMWPLAERGDELSVDDLVEAADVM